MTRPATPILVTGGVRSGKSRYAERLLRHWAGPQGRVTYLATGPIPDPGDPEWQARVAEHRRRRPAWWHTVETRDVATALDGIGADDAVLVDCLGTWLTGVLDGAGAWDEAPGWESVAAGEIDALVRAVAACRGIVVLVSNEVGWGVVPATRSGRVFADLLGDLNRQVGQRCAGVVLMVAGRPLPLPPVPDPPGHMFG